MKLLLFILYTSLTGNWWLKVWLSLTFGIGFNWLMITIKQYMNSFLSTDWGNWKCMWLAIILSGSPEERSSSSGGRAGWFFGFHKTTPLFNTSQFTQMHLHFEVSWSEFLNVTIESHHQTCNAIQSFPWRPFPPPKISVWSTTVPTTSNFSLSLFHSFERLPIQPQAAQPQTRAANRHITRD